MENQEQIAKQAYSKMARLCSRSEQCSSDIKKKIMAFELPEDTVDEIIKNLTEEKYLDDERYAKAYAKDKFRFNKWGRIKIRHYLKLKDLSETVIQTALNEIDEEKYKKVLIQTLKAKAKKVKKKNRYEKMGQVIRFAQTRGFEPEIIHRYLNLVIE